MKSRSDESSARKIRSKPQSLPRKCHADGVPVLSNEYDSDRMSAGDWPSGVSFSIGEVKTKPRRIRTWRA